MFVRTAFTAFAAAHLLLAPGIAGPASADEASVAQFYGGSRINIIIASSMGGAFGLQGRLLAEHMPKYIPGKPNMIVTSMPGAGGTRAANYMANVAAKDGTAISVPLTGVMLAPLIRPDGVRYDITRFGWIGAIAPITDTISVLAGAPATTLDALKTTEVVIGASGKGSQIYQEPALARQLLGVKFKIAWGYKGGREVMLAMEQGEVHGRALASTSWMMQKPEWVSSRRIIHLMQVGPSDPSIGDVPRLYDLVAEPRHKRLVEVMEIAPRTGWSSYAPPGLPAERLAALRRAFDMTMKDPAYIAAVRKRVNVVVSPRTGEEMQAYAQTVMQLPKELVAEFRKAIE